MVDLVQTPANVALAAGGGSRRGIAGATIVAGNSLYLNSSGQLVPAQHDVSAVEAACVGIALNGGATGQPIRYATAGNINVGATLTVGETYVVGAGDGAIAPVADVGTGQFPTILGVATAADTLKMGILQGGVARA